MIRQNSEAIPAVSIRLLETIATVAEQAHRKEDRKALLRQADMVIHGCRDRLSADNDREDLENRYRKVVKALNESPARITANADNS
jgi:uncharacterized membrane protein